MTTTMTPASAPTTPDAVEAPLEGSPGIPFRRLLEVERRKIVDTRSGAWLLGITALLTALTLAVMLIWGESDGLGFMGLLSVATMPLSLLLPILGILTATTRATPAWVPSTTVSHHIYAAWTWAVLAALWLLWHRRRFVKRDEE